MRFAIVSDIHANLQAWNAVLLDIRCNRVDKIICLGDCVGYGPDPADVLRSLHQNVDFLVLGNHDAVVCGKMDAALFNDAARDIITWTGKQLNSQAIAFLRSLPLSLAGPGFRCTHGDFSQPAAFHYIIEAEEAVPSWEARPEPLLFVGHTHQPNIFVRGASGRPHVLEPQDFVLEEGKRFLLNVGSVGQPRDGEPRACYCLYDSVEKSVFWRRVPFDIDAYRDGLRRAGLNEKPSYFLRHDPRKGRPPLRELLNFSPPRSPAQGVRDVVEVRNIETLQKRVRTWKRMFTVLLVAALAASTLAGTAWWKHAHRGGFIPGASLAPIDPTRLGEDANLISPLRSPLPPGSPIPGWDVRMGHRKRQSAAVVPDDEGRSCGVRLTSSTARDELRLSATPLQVAKGGKARFSAVVEKSPDFDGTIEAVYSLTKQSDGGTVVVDQFCVKEPTRPVPSGELKIMMTNRDPLPAGSQTLQLQIRGRFTGTVTLKDLTLTAH